MVDCTLSSVLHYVIRLTSTSKSLMHKVTDSNLETRFIYLVPSSPRPSSLFPRCFSILSRSPVQNTDYILSMSAVYQGSFQIPTGQIFISIRGPKVQPLSSLPDNALPSKEGAR